MKNGDLRQLAQQVVGEPNELRLHLEKAASIRMIPAAFVQGIHVDYSLEASFIRDELLVQMWRYVYYEQRGELEVPADWWQHFKQRFFPAWALRRWPVQNVVFEARRYFPEMAVPERKLGTTQVFGFEPS